LLGIVTTPEHVLVFPTANDPGEQVAISTSEVVIVTFVDS